MGQEGMVAGLERGRGWGGGGAVACGLDRVSGIDRLSMILGGVMHFEGWLILNTKKVLVTT